MTKREIFCLVLAVVVAAAISEKSFRDGNGTPLDGRRRYIPYLATFWLPPLMLVFALLPCFGLLSFRHVLSVFFSVLLSMCVYDACLLPGPAGAAAVRPVPGPAPCCGCCPIT